MKLFSIKWKARGALKFQLRIWPIFKTAKVRKIKTLTRKKLKSLKEKSLKRFNKAMLDFRQPTLWTKNQQIFSSKARKSPKTHNPSKQNPFFIISKNTLWSHYVRASRFGNRLKKRSLKQLLGRFGKISPTKQKSIPKTFFT